MAAVTFEQVYADCHRKVQALCVHLLGNHADAQDAFQDTFVAVARALPQFRGDANVSTWVHRIAVRVALRHRSRRKPSDELDDNVPAETNLARTSAEAQRVKRAMMSVSFEHRVVLALFGVAGLTHAEIAETLGIPEGTVWSRLHNAKKQLAIQLTAIG